MAREIKILSKYTISIIANNLLSAHSMDKTIKEEELNYINTPIVIQNENYLTWVDKYYIAIQKKDSDIKYIYITRIFVKDELKSFKETVKRAKGNDINVERKEKLLLWANDCIKEFTKYLKEMEELEVDYLLVSKYEKLIDEIPLKLRYDEEDNQKKQEVNKKRKQKKNKKEAS